MISDRTYFNAYVGHWLYHTSGEGYTDAPAAYDTVTLRYWGRYQGMPYGVGRHRWQYNLPLSRFVPNAWGGSHDIKLGAEFTDEDRGVTTRSGANFARITGIVPPRIARLGVTFSF